MNYDYSEFRELVDEEEYYRRKRRKRRLGIDSGKGW